jgi:hypothetical protein
LENNLGCPCVKVRKDLKNRDRGLRRLEEQIKSGRLTKSSINNKGYNKYLKLRGAVTIEIDYERYEADAAWDGIKIFITNTELKAEEVIENYRHLWFIERAFRINKTDDTEKFLGCPIGENRRIVYPNNV